MDSIKSICVFCGSSPEADEKYMILARAAGMLMARHGFEIIYGGARIGMMGAMADAALGEKGKVTGIIPRFLKDMEVAHTGLSELHLTDTMHERQMEMSNRAGAFVALPGGLGTLAEFFEAVTWRQMGLHDKPIALLNAHGYWDGLLAQMDAAESSGFLRSHDKKLFTVLESAGDLGDFLGRLKKGINSVLSDG